MNYDYAPRGEYHYRSSLTNDDVRLIRALVAERQRLLSEAAKLSNRAIADKFNLMNDDYVRRIHKREAWSHVA